MLKSNLILPLICVSFIGCTSFDEIQPSVENATEIRDFYVTLTDTNRIIDSEAKALDIAGRFFKSEFPTSRAISMSTIETVSSDSGNPLMYIVNYGDNGGFVIISAKKDTQPILAYSDTGSFDITAIKDSPIEMWVDEMKQIVENSYLIPDSIKLGYAAEWRKLTNTQQLVTPTMSRGWGDDADMAVVNEVLYYYYEQGYEIVMNPTSDVHIYPYDLNNFLDGLSDDKLWEWDGHSQREKSILLSKYKDYGSSIRPMVTTQWHFGYPYNVDLPGNLGLEYEKYNFIPLDCHNVALCQIMKYYKKDNIFDYDKMPDILTKETDTDSFKTVTSFIDVIGRVLGINYKNPDTSGLDSCDLYPTLNLYGFKNIKTIDYDFFSLKSYLAQGPILLSADIDEKNTRGGHTWICDGYSHVAGEMEYLVLTYNGNYMDAVPQMCFTEVFRTYVSTPGYSNLHMNWGVGETYNGFYSSNDWALYDGESYTQHYNKNRKAIVDFS